MAATVSAGRWRWNNQERLGWIALVLALILGLALRVWLNVRAGWMIDGDEALFGIGAVRLLHGQPPNLLYGVPYMGMLQSYLAAPFVAALGPKAEALRAATLLSSLAYVVVTWLLARAWYGTTVAALAALFAAVPAVYFDAVGLKVWGSYLDIMVLGGMVLREVWRLRQAKGGLPLWRWFALGAVTGLAVWANLLVISYLVTAVLLIPWRCWRRWLRPAIVFGAPGLVLGGLPLWWYNIAQRGATFRWALGGANAANPQTGAVVRVLWTTLLPRVTGLTSPWSAVPAPVAYGLAAILVSALALACDDSLRQWRRARRGNHRSAPAAAPLLLFLAISLTIYVVSGFGRTSLTPYDGSGRYLLPVWTAVPILLAALCQRLGALWLPAGVIATAAILGINLSGHVAANPRLIFQSPYWNRLPGNEQPVVDWLQRHNIHAVWMNHWAGDQVMYLSNDTILAADYYDIVVGHGINRFPSVFQRVAQSPATAFVVVSNDPSHPALGARLTALGVTYRHVALGGYQIYLPTSRRVDPAEVRRELRYPY